MITFLLSSRSSQPLDYPLRHNTDEFVFQGEIPYNYFFAKPISVSKSENELNTTSGLGADGSLALM